MTCVFVCPISSWFNTCVFVYVRVLPHTYIYVHALLSLSLSRTHKLSLPGINNNNLRNAVSSLGFGRASVPPLWQRRSGTLSATPGPPRLNAVEIWTATCAARCDGAESGVPSSPAPLWRSCPWKCPWTTVAVCCPVLTEFGQSSTELTCSTELSCSNNFQYLLRAGVNCSTVFENFVAFAVGREGGRGGAEVYTSNIGQSGLRRRYQGIFAVARPPQGRDEYGPRHNELADARRGIWRGRRRRAGTNRCYACVRPCRH